MEGRMNSAGTKVKSECVGSDGFDDLERADEFVVEIHGRAGRFDVTTVDHDKGTRGEGRGVVRAAVCVGVFRITVVCDGDKVRSSLVCGSEFGGVCGGVWNGIVGGVGRKVEQGGSTSVQGGGGVVIVRGEEGGHADGGME